MFSFVRVTFGVGPPKPPPSLDFYFTAEAQQPFQVDGLERELSRLIAENENIQMGEGAIEEAPKELYTVPTQSLAIPQIVKVSWHNSSFVFFRATIHQENSKECLNSRCSYSYSKTVFSKRILDTNVTTKSLLTFLDHFLADEDVDRLDER